MREISFERLRSRLLRGGVTSKYTRRTISELEAHFEELKIQLSEGGVLESEIEREAYKRLGDEDSILEHALSKPELKTIAYRFQKTVFLLLPLILYLLLIIPLAIVVYEIIPVRAGINHSDYWPDWYYFLIANTAFTIEYLLAPFFVVGLYFYAKNRYVDLKWPLIGILLISFLASGWDNYAVPPGDAAQRAYVLFHWGYGFMPWRIVQSDWITTLEQLLRFALNLGIIATLEMRHRRLQWKHREE